jgi:hypothetical protein
MDDWKLFIPWRKIHHGVMLLCDSVMLWAVLWVAVVEGPSLILDWEVGFIVFIVLWGALFFHDLARLGDCFEDTFCLEKRNLVRRVMINDWRQVRWMCVHSHFDVLIWEDAVGMASRYSFTKPLQELLAGGPRTNSVPFVGLGSPEVVSLLVKAGFSVSDLRLTLRASGNEKVWRAAISCTRNTLGETPLNMAHRKDSLCAVSAHEVMWRRPDVHAIGTRARFARLINAVILSPF